MKKTLLSLSSLLLLAACAEPDQFDEYETEDRFFALSDLSTVASYSGIQGLENPESVVTEFDGSKYVSLAITGLVDKVDKFGNRSTLANLPNGVPFTQCSGGFINIQGAMARDWDGDLYVTLNACDDNRGIWKVDKDTGATSQLAQIPDYVLANGIARYQGNLFVADSNGSVWTLPLEGGQAQLFSDDPLLEQSGVIIDGIPVPGPNGLQFYGNEMYVANASQGTIVRIEVEYDNGGNPVPGEPEIYHQADVGCDDIAMDLIGGIYCTTDPFQTVTYIDRITGYEKVMWTAEDGLDGPTAVAFGRGAEANKVFITNAQFPFFASTGNGASLMKATVLIPGYPFR